MVAAAAEGGGSAESGGPREVLRKKEPLTRESLSDPDVVEALWEEAERHPATGAPSPLECGTILRDGPWESRIVHEYEIATALDYHDVADVPQKRTSDAFRARLRA